ncbi:MAG TPA: YeeE/YedE thiosulfate transporter family protein, partial [Gammaproteobacteria bacterium]|nr:YeeE/YedE thiosulfate transporter family protein [Gammaproteobacteria bacterium]
MELNLYAQSLLWAFGLSLVFGAIANKTNFCTMGAVSDWVNIGDQSRLRAWFLAIATAIIGVGILEYSGSIDMSLTTSNDTSNPPYRSPNFIWLRHLVGGLMFGVGMTLASGCGNKTLVRLGEGNMKSLVVLAIIGVAAWWMLFSNFGYYVFLQWMLPLGIDFSQHDIAGQDIATVLAGLSGS